MTSITLITPGCRNVRNFLAAFLAKGSRDLLVLMSKLKTQQGEPSSYILSGTPTHVFENVRHTFLVPLCSAQIDSPTSILSPSVTGNELDLAMAEATADLRKSIDFDRKYNQQLRHSDLPSRWMVTMQVLNFSLAQLVLYLRATWTPQKMDTLHKISPRSFQRLPSQLPLTSTSECNNRYLKRHTLTRTSCKATGSS